MVRLNEKFDFICLSKIGLSCLEFLKNVFKGYKCKYVPPKSSKCGGVAFFYKQTYKVELIHDLKINSVSDDLIDVDEIWLKAETEKGPPIGFHGTRDKAFLSHGIRDSLKKSHGIRD